MSSSKLGFGMMRLPQRSPEATDIDFDQVSQMVDRFLEAGFTYFDTSWAYHNGASETAVKRCLVSRHPRDRFVLASKLPTFAITREEEAEEIFAQQLERCGVDYFDYYLLHNVNWMRCRQIIRDARLFEHMQQWKEQGKIRHIAFSFHDTADVLDQILTEHPEVEAVQIALNYFDWDARYIQARRCYETHPRPRQTGHRHGAGKGRYAGKGPGGGRGADAGPAAGGLHRVLGPSVRRRAGWSIGCTVRHVHPGAGGGQHRHIPKIPAHKRERAGDPAPDRRPLPAERPCGHGGFYSL